MIAAFHYLMRTMHELAGTRCDARRAAGVGTRSFSSTKGRNMRAWMTTASMTVWLLATTAAVQATPLSSLNTEAFPRIKADRSSYVGATWPGTVADPDFQAGAGAPGGVELFRFEVSTAWGFPRQNPTGPGSSGDDSNSFASSFQLNSGNLPSGAGDLSSQNVLWYSASLTSFGCEATDPQFAFTFAQAAAPPSDLLRLNPTIPVESQIGVRLTMDDSAFKAGIADSFAAGFAGGFAADPYAAAFRGNSFRD